MTDVTTSIPEDATGSDCQATEEAHLLALDRYVLNDLAGPLLACFKQCADDEHCDDPTADPPVTFLLRIMQHKGRTIVEWVNT